MSTNRKTCRKCKKRKMYNEFYRHPEGKDGHVNICKECKRSDARIHNYGACASCGKHHYKGAGYKLCKECRGTVVRIAIPSNGNLSCGVGHGQQVCVFVAECRDNIRMQTFTPYCFVSCKYHGLYVKEYGRRVAA